MTSRELSGHIVCDAPRDSGMLPLASERPVSLTVGWRLVAGLVALALFMVVLVAVLPGRRTSSERLDPVMAVPWQTCAQGVRRQIAPLADAEIAGPMEALWERSGAAVEMLGSIRQWGQPERPFACRAVLLGGRWTLDRILLAR